MALQSGPSRAINLRIVVCSIMLLFFHPPFISLTIPPALPRVQRNWRRKRSQNIEEVLWNVFELRSRSDPWNQVDKFVLSCLIIRINWRHFWHAFKHPGWRPMKSSVPRRGRIRRNAARIRWIIRELRPDFFRAHSSPRTAAIVAKS